MSQPEWKLLFATDYSALYVDTTGVYDPELQIAQEYNKARGATRFMVYRFPLERCWKLPDGSLTDMDPASKDLPYPIEHYRPWFAESLAEVATSVGEHVDNLIDLLCSDDPGNLANVYESIGDYHGFDNFDQYPEDWTESAMAAWPERGRMRITLEPSEDDNGMVTITCNDQEACRDDQTVEGSRWECPRDRDIGYASVMDRPGLLADLEKEYEVDASDYSPPDKQP